MTRIAFITGASRGIGYAIAKSLAKQGFSLVLTARTKAKLEEVSETCRKLGAETLPLKMDVNDYQAVVYSIDKAIQHFGKINILIANHGIATKSAAFNDSDDDELTRVIDTNLKASMFVTKKVLPHIINASKKDQNDCALIYLSSVCGKQGFPGFASYCASKFGLNGFAQSLYEEIKEYGIKVTSINPGWVNTEMPEVTGFNLNKNNMIQPDDIGELVSTILKSPPTMCPVDITLLPQRQVE